MVNLTNLSTVIENPDGSYVEVHVVDDSKGSAGTVAIVLIVAAIVATLICSYFCRKMKKEQDEHYTRQK